MIKQEERKMKKIHGIVLAILSAFRFLTITSTIHIYFSFTFFTHYIHGKKKCCEKNVTNNMAAPLLFQCFWHYSSIKKLIIGKLIMDKHIEIRVVLTIYFQLRLLNLTPTIFIRNAPSCTKLTLFSS